ncbi:hypothetical protein PYW08_009327 [Mythimna loreyi]|uniref:Uncharacterized protein n=1 Tax=Mythimna loreyi TaxID=667449 RepID=A0ACC2Q8A3_9NEOP|nr:hypothetical protein PYW08_009327 [Mythimna loreyi]
MVAKIICLILMKILILIVLCEGFSANNLTLKQVLILSRHNIKYPWSNVLHKYSSKPWPPQAGASEVLTPKGAQLEGYMGEYFSEWFKKEHFLPEGCPDEDTVYVYANAASRTKATARAFVDSAFKSCNVSVLYHKNLTDWDPLFRFVVYNSTEAYKDKVLQEINRKLRNNPKLLAVYSELNKILEIEDSQVCKQDGICDLTQSNDTVSYEVGKFVVIEGPFRKAYLVVNAFVMNYYNGMPIQDIAWGQVTTLEKWNLITEVTRLNQVIRFTTVADREAPLVKYLIKTFKEYDEMPKLMLLVGHDINLNCVANALGFKSIDLPNQFEKYPIGGKIVFQRWTDSKSDYLKVEYVYPSWSQLRNGSKYSLESPPQTVVMRLNWCNTDEHGFCPWNEFVDKL